jgi:hypothetical protein
MVLSTSLVLKKKTAHIDNLTGSKLVTGAAEQAYNLYASKEEKEANLHKKGEKGNY